MFLPVTWCKPQNSTQMEFAFMGSKRLFPTFVVKNSPLLEELSSANHIALRAFLDTCRRPARRY